MRHGLRRVLFVLTGKGAPYQHKEHDEGRGGAPSGSSRAGGPDLLSA